LCKSKFTKLPYIIAIHVNFFIIFERVKEVLDKQTLTIERHMKNGYIPFIFLIFTTLITQGQKIGDNKTEYWVDLSYINCLKYNLPCDCDIVKMVRGVAPSIIKYSLNSIDSLFFDKRQRILNFLNQNNDVFSFDLRDIMSEFRGDTIFIAHVEIKNDTLLYLNYNDSILYTYIPIKQNYWTILDSISVQRINEILLKNNQENIYKPVG
jgi:hypothetical protein